MFQPYQSIFFYNNDNLLFTGIKAISEVSDFFIDVEIIAPDRQQSAEAYAITISTFL